MTSFLWWIVGFYWVVSGSETLMQNAPRLYWLGYQFLLSTVYIMNAIDFSFLCFPLSFEWRYWLNFSINDLKTCISRDGKFFCALGWISLWFGNWMTSCFAILKTELWILTVTKSFGFKFDSVHVLFLFLKVSLNAFHAFLVVKKLVCCLNKNIILVFDIPACSIFVVSSVWLQFMFFLSFKIW